jgi:hypothetical protein
MKEASIQNLIRIAAAKHGCTLFRNTIGAGIIIRHKNNSIRLKIIRAVIALVEKMGGSAYYTSFGLCPDSADLIGIKRTVITQEMVGCIIGVFTAPEVKIPGKYATPEQENFLEFVRKNGGIAGVVHSPEEVISLLTGGK